jgi:predicted RNase H-like HicB family nuclease
MSAIQGEIMNKLNFKIEKDGDEFHAYVPELPGCHTHGKTIKEAIENLKDAMQLYIDCIMEEQLSEQILDIAV